GRGHFFSLLMEGPPSLFAGSSGPLAMFEILEHTADIGFRARGRTLPDLFEQAAEALVSIALELEDVSPKSEYPLRATGSDYESLLVNWLKEVLYSIDGERLALHRFRVTEVSATRVSGVALGEPCDPARHRAKLIVKGVTYHQLQVRQTAEGWGAEGYLDI